ncbi:hypothetical protein SAMN04487977_10331 [Treponema bryantii]|uniref:Lipoprotein n=1 Tax=Treponema bryantii TaxID=163 RepID=A0A1H9E5Y4_9SPIR|nr:hypothetical protein [Treponema bryantii]SEQ21035.1 hypothetical protein SAMN04487977_10331 [Treponema bryantii]
MKKLTILSVLFITFALFFTGCNHTISTPPQSNDFNAQLPARIGTDEFTGKSITRISNYAHGKYVFNDDNTVDYYSYQNDNYLKSIKLEYSYNSEDKILYLAYRGFYRNNILITKIEDYLSNIIHPTDGYTYTEEYINLFRGLYRLYAKQIIKYYYAFSNNDNNCSLPPTLGTSLDTSSSFEYYGSTTVLNNNQGDSLTLDFPIIYFNSHYYAFQANYSVSSMSPSSYNYNQAYLTNITESTADLYFTNQNETTSTTIEVFGKAKIHYTITKISDTEGSATIHLSDFDNGLKEYYRNFFISTLVEDYSDMLFDYLQKDISIDFQNTPEEYTVQTNQE